jgi:hypothetical protein
VEQLVCQHCWGVIPMHIWAVTMYLLLTRAFELDMLAAPLQALALHSRLQ